MIFNLTPPESTAVEFIEQTLTDTQKAQARTNIGALSIDDVPGGGMELLGDAYVTSYSDTPREISIPVASGYKCYLMFFSNNANLSSIDISTIADARRRNTGGYLKYDGSSWSSNSSSPSSYDTDSWNRCRFVDLSDVYGSGYVIWWIYPMGSQYSFGAMCSIAGYKTSYIGTIYQSSAFSLDVCTPKSFSLSGFTSGLSQGTGATVYGIK